MTKPCAGDVPSAKDMAVFFSEKRRKKGVCRESVRNGVSSERHTLWSEMYEERKSERDTAA